MAAESSPSHPTSAPPFSCRIPAELLRDLSDKERRFYTQSDAVDQKIDWLVEHSLAQASTLEGVLRQTTATNGKVLAAQADIIALKETTAPVVRAYSVGVSAAKSKWFWGAVAAFVFFGLPLAMKHAPSPTTFLQTLFGL